MIKLKYANDPQEGYVTCMKIELKIQQQSYDAQNQNNMKDTFHDD